MSQKKSKNVITTILLILYLISMSLFILIYMVLNALFQWFQLTFCAKFVQIMYTIRSPLKGADTHFLRNAVKFVLPSLLISIALIIGLILVDKLVRKWTARITLKSKAIGITLLVVGIAVRCILFYEGFTTSHLILRNVNASLGVTEYFRMKAEETKIYDDYYVDPIVDDIKADNPKNLLYIYMESMETTYASVNEGGKQQDVNYIPNLTTMSKEYISFSDKELLGGFHSSYGTDWTMAAMFASQAGVPFLFPEQQNDDFSERQGMANGSVTLGDILNQKGYYQEFLCGSDATFAGRKQFYTQHGNYHIYDNYSAVDDGYLTEDDFVWWGLADKDLYRIAKDELTRISKLDQPFNLTMLTVDTHHVDGYVCELCGNEYDTQLGNVVACADKQIEEFIEWCQQQPWYEDTVIVILGDHPRMDNSLVDGVDYVDRTVYNCFINTEYDKDNLNLKNRVMTTMDLYPTVLASIGFSIPNDRLGIGTNLFSDKPTLAEQMGYETFNNEMKKYSSFYIKKCS